MEPIEPFKGKSHSAVKRRRRAKAKAGWSAVQRYHELQRAMPEVRRRANVIRRVDRQIKLEGDGGKKLRLTKFLNWYRGNRSQQEF